MSAPSTSTSTPPTAITIQQLRKGSQQRITAYKPNINIKPKINNNEIIENNGGNNIYQAMINTMQSKLNKQRKSNLELQGQIDDLRAENQRLRKSKVDLMTWSNSEIAKYKKK
eukprot:406382_1